MTAEQLYSQLREREGRTYSDAEVARLPEVPRSHPHRVEWQARAASADRLSAYLARRASTRTILELGCGNGWLTSRLALGDGRLVVGVDVNHRELAQARRVFRARAGSPAFVCADIFQAPLPPRALDVIVLAAAVQYFPDLRALVAQLARLLAETGEIHILDSPFYADAEIAAARARSRAHFDGMGLPAMAAHYHHHRLSEIGMFGPEVLHDRPSILGGWRRIRGAIGSPFPWIRIRPAS